MPRKPRAASAGAELDAITLPPVAVPDVNSAAVEPAVTVAEFETQQWKLATLMQAALLRRLLDDSAPGSPRMVAAEIAAALNFLKEYAARTPDEAPGADPFAQFEDE